MYPQTRVPTNRAKQYTLLQTAPLTDPLPLTSVHLCFTEHLIIEPFCRNTSQELVVNIWQIMA